ncbi:Uncharacterised protein [uncultured archaeon]|nr:Uncharacterised protein [uncultured archaeon]
MHCSNGKLGQSRTCVLPVCTADGACNPSCSNDPDCCLIDGFCPSLGCAKGDDQDCCLENDSSCGGGGGGGGDSGNCTACGSDSFCNVCCSNDPDCGKPECGSSSDCGQAFSCVKSRCVYAPLSVHKGEGAGNGTFVIIYAPANASLNDRVQLNVTFINGTASPKVMVVVKYPDGSEARVIADAQGHAFFNATAPGFYYYETFGVILYQSTITRVPAPGQNPGNTTDMIFYSDISPTAFEKSLVVPVTISEPSALTLSVSDEGNRSVPSALRIKSPSAEIQDNSTSDSGMYSSNYSDLGKYVFTITAKRSVGRLYAKISLERLPLQVAFSGDFTTLALIILIVLAIAAAYFFRKTLAGLIAFGKGAKSTLLTEKPVHGRLVQVLLESGKKPLAEKKVILLFRDTGELYELETDEKGIASFIPQAAGLYELQIEGYSVDGDRKFTVD